MSGELHDLKYPEETSIYRARTTDTEYIFVVASSLVTIFFCIVKPLLLYYVALPTTASTGGSSQG